MYVNGHRGRLGLPGIKEGSSICRCFSRPVLRRQPAVLRAEAALRAVLRLTESHGPRGLRQPYVHPSHIGVVPGPQPPPRRRQAAQHRQPGGASPPAVLVALASRFGLSLSLRAAAVVPLLPPRRGHAGRRRSGCGYPSLDRARPAVHAPT